MKRLVLVMAVLLAVMANPVIVEAQSKNDEIVDFAPNPFDDDYATSQEELQAAYDKLVELYNSFDFEDLIQAYYDYARELSEYYAIKEEWDDYEAEHPINLKIIVLGTDLKKDPNSNASRPEWGGITAKDRTSAIDKPVQAKITITNVLTELCPLPEELPVGDTVRVADTNKKGILYVRHFMKGEEITIKAEAEGYLTGYKSGHLKETCKTTIRLEKNACAIMGMVSGLYPVELGEGGPNEPEAGDAHFPLPRAMLLFRHSSGRAYETQASWGGTWPTEKKVPYDWECEKGRYYIGRMLPGRYEVRVYYPGYETFENKLSLDSETDPKLQNFILAPMVVNPLADDGKVTASSNGTSVTGTETGNVEDPFSK